MVIFINLGEALKQEGEDCGACFSPANNYHCGTCASGLECREDPISGPQIPDLPKRCRKETGIFIIHNFIAKF